MKLIKVYGRKSDATKLFNKLMNDNPKAELEVVTTKDKKFGVREKQVEAKKLSKRNRSKISGPCSKVWDICEAELVRCNDSKTPLSRKAVIEKCEGAGIAFYTARTQYQAWKTASGI